jgi:DNA replication licensing factor MCM5
VEFIRNFRRGREAYYREQLSRNYSLKHYYLEVSLADLARFNEELYNELLGNPTLFVEVFEMAAKEALIATLPAAHDLESVPSIQVLLVGDITPIPLRGLSSDHVSKLVCVTGIVISSSRVQAKATKLGIQCKFCKFRTEVHVGSGISTTELPKECLNPNPNPDPAMKCRPNPYVVLPESTSYIDQQLLKLQESPETIPTGEMPRHIQLLVERNLVSRAVPGTRVVLVGVSALYGAGRNGNGMSDNSVRTPYIKALGIQVEGAGGGGRIFSSFSEDEVSEFKAMARRPDVYEYIVSQIAPVIYGHEDIKKALACQLFGGCRKVLPDGMKLRGDINVLLLGDPGTAKSQLLKFIERVAPIGVYTSGKGSSAAGLTASVVRDPQSREFYLEGGAMVLADGGIVCIDEFDKMRQQDRVAIHEAMEQQTISIAKAGITTILNSRSAVAAAANPSFGVYDETHSAAEHFDDFKSTILSRFDTIFLVKDLRDAKRDEKVSKHVVDLHMRKSKAAGTSGAGSNPSALLRKDRARTFHQDGDIQKLKRYIAYCRMHCAPRLTETASTELVNHYVSMRKAFKERERTGEGNAVPITVRQLEAIVRLSEALAKMSLSVHAREDHVAEAIRLFTVSSIEATNSGKVTMERLADATRIEVEHVETLIKRRVPIDSTIRIKLLEAQLVKLFGVSDISIRRAIAVMIQKEQLEFRYQRKALYRKR